MSTTTTISRQALLHISPPPRTLTDTLAILTHLRTHHGQITTFLNPRYVPHLRQPNPNPTKTTIPLLFTTPSALTSALSASPLTIPSLDPSTPSPTELDPFNIRGLQSRSPLPESLTFTVEVHQDNNPNRHQEIVRSNPFYGGFRVDTRSPMYADLVGQRIPARGMAVVLSPSGKGYTNGRRDLNEIKGVGAELGLMEMWRRALRKKEEGHGEDRASAEDGREQEGGT